MDPDSLCLQEMVHAFMHQQQEEAANCSQLVGGSFLQNGSMEAGPDEDCLAVGGLQEKTRILKVVLRDCGEAELDVLAHVTTFVETNGRQQNRATLQRSVITHLRSRGYDAAICKSQPRDQKRIPPGKNEYIDVIMNTHNDSRVVVDIDFRAQFEIARPTKQYAALLELIPSAYVGNGEKLLQIVKIMAECAKESLKAKRMQIPPWRTYTYMISKWLGSYKRITNFSCSSTDDQKRVREGTSFSCIGWKPCNGGEEKKIMLRLASVLMEAGLKSMSGTEPSGSCRDELRPELVVA